ncbi:hypothetical protein Taro_056513 [Colocasia esculenta]|uniref:Uncharacterized protein n=1 Tax=Colocasia esculenta TaxID=4460 RepID=A0A843XU57_COLES|nr:hypothetical protein [Colocasia esculenta]
MRCRRQVLAVQLAHFRLLTRACGKVVMRVAEADRAGIDGSDGDSCEKLLGVWCESRGELDDEICAIRFFRRLECCRLPFVSGSRCCRLLFAWRHVMLSFTSWLVAVDAVVYLQMCSQYAVYFPFHGLRC